MFRSWLNSLKLRLLRRLGRRHARPLARPRFRPRVEELENRLAPAAIVSWVGGATGSWGVATNWSTGNLPGAGDDVVINGPVTVSHAAGADSIHTLSLGSGATLQVVGNSSIIATAIGGPQVTDNGTIALGDSNSAGDLLFSAAAASVAGAGDILFGSSVGNEFGQLPGGQALTLGAGVTLHGQSGSVGLGSAAFDNQGAIQSDVAGGTITFNQTGTFTNDGTVKALNGGTIISANPFTNAGTVVVGAGSTLTAPYTQTGGLTSLEGGTLANFGPPPGNSLSFNGTSDFVQVPNSPSLDSQALTSQATLEAWVYLDQLPSAAGHIMQIVAKSEMANDLDWQIQTDNRIYFYAGNQFPNVVVSNTVLQAGQWYHLAATYQAGAPGRLQLFINGVLDASQTGNFARITNPNPLSIGSSLVWPGRFFNGLITDVSVWNVVETQAQIQSDMSVNLQGTEPGLVAAWAFSEGAGVTAHDLTANHNDGLLGNWVSGQSPAWTVSPVAGVDIQGGSLAGSGTVDGNLTISGGTLTVGMVDPGWTLAVNGSYTQGSGATLEILVGGPSSSGTFGTLAVTGPAAVAGTLTVTTVNGYTPTFTDSYTVLTSPSVSGSFSTYNFPSLGGEPLLTAGGPAGAVLTGTQSPTTTTLASSAGPSTYGQPVTLTATVTAASGNTPTGTVDFRDVTTGQDLGAAVLQVGGGLDQASVVVPGFAAGAHSIEALYTSSHPGTFADSSSPALSQDVDPAVPVVSVTAADGTYNGSAFVATATVTGTSGTPATALEGVRLTLTYYAGATALPAAPVDAGTYTVVATFAGSPDYAAASASTTFTIAPALLTVRANDAARVFGQANPAFTDTISGFVNGETSQVLSGSASLSTSATTSSPVGTYAIVAAQGTLSAANYAFVFVDGTLTVNPDTTTTSLLVQRLGNRVTLIATVLAKAPGSGTPASSVDFRDATTGRDLGSVQLVNGSATLVVRLPGGSHAIIATFSGDSNFLTSSASVTGHESLLPRPR
jgi:hypothetical protein